MDTEFSVIRKKINIAYYGLYVLYLVLIGVFGFLVKPSEHALVMDPLEKGGQALSYVVILYILVSIPGALWWFKQRMKAVSAMEEGASRERAYLRYAIARVLIIGMGAVLAIPAFYVLGGHQPMLWCAAIAVIAQYFCKPTDRKIYLEINNKSEEEL